MKFIVLVQFCWYWVYCSVICDIFSKRICL